MVYLLCYKNSESVCDKFKLSNKDPGDYNLSHIIKIYAKTPNDLKTKLQADYSDILSEDLIDYIDQYTGEDDDIKFFELDQNTRMFHSSTKIFKIQCFIEKYRSLIDKYLNNPSFRKINIPNRIKTVLRKFINGTRSEMWNFHTIYIKIILYLKRLEMIDVSITYILSDLYPDINLRSLFIKNFLEFSKKVEVGFEKFDPVFYSSMNQPIQFFSIDINLSRIFGNKMYEYNLDENIHLIDLTDKSTVLYLLEKIFVNNEEISEEDASYYFPGWRKQTAMDDFYSDLFYDENLDVRMKLYEDLFQGNEELKNLLGSELDSNTVLNKIKQNWSKYYDLEIFSPRGFFVYSSTRILCDEGTDRRSQYYTDSIMIKILREKTSYQGWVSDVEGFKEVMIIHPELYGNMVPYENINFTRDCEEPKSPFKIDGYTRKAINKFKKKLSNIR